MRITKRQLRRIINEEFRRVLFEQEEPTGPWDEAESVRAKLEASPVWQWIKQLLPSSVWDPVMQDADLFAHLLNRLTALGAYKRGTLRRVVNVVIESGKPQAIVDRLGVTAEAIDLLFDDIESRLSHMGPMG